MSSFPTEQAAADSLIADGFTRNERGYFSKPSRTGGNLLDAPRDCIAICEIIHNRVDPQWNAPDFYTIRFL
jgi:hypothetical protein